MTPQTVRTISILIYLAAALTAYCIFLWDLRRRSINSDKDLKREVRSSLAFVTSQEGK